MPDRDDLPTSDDLVRAARESPGTSGPGARPNDADGDEGAGAVAPGPLPNTGGMNDDVPPTTPAATDRPSVETATTSWRSLPPGKWRTVVVAAAIVMGVVAGVSAYNDARSGPGPDERVTAFIEDEFGRPLTAVALTQLKARVAVMDTFTTCDEFFGYMITEVAAGTESLEDTSDDGCPVSVEFKITIREYTDGRTQTDRTRCRVRPPTNANMPLDSVRTRLIRRTRSRSFTSDETQNGTAGSSSRPTTLSQRSCS